MPRKRPSRSPQPPPARVPLGEPLAWTDADLDALSEVSAQDISAAQRWAARNADEEDAGLWTAEEKEEEEA
jgi:hypothetical protein